MWPPANLSPAADTLPLHKFRSSTWLSHGRGLAGIGAVLALTRTDSDAVYRSHSSNLNPESNTEASGARCANRRAREQRCRPYRREGAWSSGSTHQAGASSPRHILDLAGEYCIEIRSAAGPTVHGIRPRAARGWEVRSVRLALQSTGAHQAECACGAHSREQEATGHDGCDFHMFCRWDRERIVLVDDAEFTFDDAQLWCGFMKDALDYSRCGRMRFMVFSS